MTNQKIKPCPECKTDEYMGVYTYDSGWRYVECDKCYYLGPGCGSVKEAIKSHNERASQ